MALSARRESRLREIAEELGADNVAYLPGDATSLDDMQALVALAKERFGKVDSVFANAGIMPAGNMSELKVDEWMAEVDVNVKGVLNLIAAAMPQFKEQGYGHVIATSSRGISPQQGRGARSAAAAPRPPISRSSARLL